MAAVAPAARGESAVAERGDWRAERGSARTRSGDALPRVLPRVLAIMPREDISRSRGEGAGEENWASDSDFSRRRWVGRAEGMEVGWTGGAVMAPIAGVGSFGTIGANVCTRGLLSSKRPPPVANSGPPLLAGICEASGPDLRSVTTDPLGVLEATEIGAGMGLISLSGAPSERGSDFVSFSGGTAAIFSSNIYIYI